MTKPPQPEPSAVVAATAMYVEVLVIGIGFLAALGAGVAAVAGPQNVSHLAALSGSTLVAGAALALAYALGILIDRVADSVLRPVRRRFRAQTFQSDSQYALARQKLAEYPAFAARADYARSRMRICRGWIVNSVILAAAIDFAIVRFVVTNRVALILAVSFLGALAALGFYVTWRSITVTSYRKLAEQTSREGVQIPSQAAPDSSTDPQATT